MTNARTKELGALSGSLKSVAIDLVRIIRLSLKQVVCHRASGNGDQDGGGGALLFPRGNHAAF